MELLIAVVIGLCTLAIVTKDILNYDSSKKANRD
jgi:Tfp pilus assembly protein PilW